MLGLGGKNKIRSLLGLGDEPLSCILCTQVGNTVIRRNLGVRSTYNIWNRSYISCVQYPLSFKVIWFDSLVILTDCHKAYEIGKDSKNAGSSSLGSTLYHFPYTWPGSIPQPCAHLPWLSIGRLFQSLMPPGEKPPSNFWINYIHAHYLPMNLSVGIIPYLKPLFECHVQLFSSSFLWPWLPLSLPMPCHTSDFFCEATVSQFSHLGLICHHPILLLVLPCLRFHLNSPLLIRCGGKCSQLYWIPSSEWS